ncbi:MAG: peroxiredoxin-like family protein [Oricola sp.]
MLYPGQKAPALAFDTVAHGRYELGASAVGNGTLLVFYRGGHCPICRAQLKELDDQIGDFAIRGIEIAALSGDSRERAKETVETMQIIRLPVGYGLDIRRARDDWGLFVSTAREGTDEPRFFNEPGHFWIAGDGTVVFSVIQSLPQIRPSANAILRAIDKIAASGAPPRGSYRGDLP